MATERPYSKVVVLPPAKVMTVAGAALTSTITTPAHGCRGQRRCVLIVDFEQSGTTRVDIQAQVRFNLEGTSNDVTTPWTPMQAQTLSSGAATLDDYVYRKTVSGNDEWRLSYDIDDDEIRFVVTSGTGTAAAGDTVQLWLRFST